MSCCCTNTLGMCDQNVCSEVEFEATATMPGVYKMIADFLNTSFIIEQEFALNDTLIFPLSELNENYEYTVQILDPLGDKVVISNDGIDYDCFKFRAILHRILISTEIESS